MGREGRKEDEGRGKRLELDGEGVCACACVCVCMHALHLQVYVCFLWTDIKAAISL